MQASHLRPELEAELIEIASALVSELRGESARDRRVGLGDSLDRDLGLDSLARVELMLRVQRAFGVDLPQQTLEQAENLGDVSDALERALRVGPREGEPASARARPDRIAPDESAGAEGEPSLATTLLDVLEWHLARQPQRTPITLLEDDVEHPISFRELADGARRVAAGLQALGLAPGQTVAIMLPTSVEYFHVYYGILIAGAIPVPIYPPARLAQIEEHVRRHVRILNNARVAMMVTVAQAQLVARLLQAQVPSLRHVAGADELLRSAGNPTPVRVSGDDVAFIQYTSGSTGDPKGVVLTHANLLANIRAMGPALGVSRDDVFISWLPLYHDMGLIGAWLATMYFGVPLVVMSPLAFLARPVRWLRAIHRYRGTMSAAPNFAYELCAKKIDDAELEGLDLGSLRLALNGAEAVLPETLIRFRDRFARCGLDPKAMMPVYGLAEASVGLAFPPPGRGPRIDSIRRDAFAGSGHALPAESGDPKPLRFVSCGRAIPGHALRIVDASGAETPERVEGRLEFTGPSATAGYRDNPQASAALIRDGWLDTGDRGYIADGELYLTGRVKDIVIRGGRNIYPHEVEEAVSEVEGVRKGCVAVFGSPDPGSGTERLVVLAETRQSGDEASSRLREAIGARVVDVLGEPADLIAIAPPHTVLKTSSGKIRRAACRELFEAGTIGAAQRTGRAQVLRLAIDALPALARRSARALAGLAYGAWVWSLFCVLTPVAWVASVLSPRVSLAWAVSRATARALFALTGTRLTVSGAQHLPADGAFVLVANHSSYLDGVVVVASLARPAGFVAKRELVDQPIARLFLRKLGAEFVERFAAHQSVEDARRMESVVRGGRSLFFFPEGTFTQVAGLRPFRLGAFVVAANAGVPVVPVAIRGTRKVLPPDSHWPRRGAIEVVIGAPIEAPADARDAFVAALALRDGAHAHIVAHCGEPDLAGHAGSQ